jgi:DNA ligase (NAD+)
VTAHWRTDLDSLAADILRHKSLYYAGQPAISDAEFDLLEDQLRKLDPDHPALTAVGGSVSTTVKKVKHSVPMLSLEKTYNTSDLFKWVGAESVVGSLKIDGLSLSLLYEQGRLILAKTRGNGREGEDVTDKIKWVQSALNRIPYAGALEIRGELCCSESRFIQVCDDMVRRNLDRPSSPRNIVAGVLGRKNHFDLSQYFDFYAFDVLGYPGLEFEIQKSELLMHWGFLNPEMKLLFSVHHVEKYLSEVRLKIEEGEIGCDGAVFTLNRLSLHSELGETSHHPRYKLSFKWQGQTATSPIQNIAWSTSRLGIVTPVALIRPVDLSGATISNVTLHNASHVRAYNLKSGDLIELVRSGEVIPKFLRVVESQVGQCSIPECCPSCGATLLVDEVKIRCPNMALCPAQQSGAILNWIVATNIEDFAEKRLQSMIEIGLVRSIPDLYRLTREKLLTLPGTKEKLAEKILTNIAKSVVLPLPVFLNGLGIEGIGLTTWEKIGEHFASLEAVCLANEDELMAVDGIALKTSQQIVNGLNNRKALISELLSVGVGVLKTETRSERLVFSGMSIVITGVLSQPRKDIEKLVKSAGGNIGSSVSKATAFVVSNDTDSNSSKMQKAKELGIPIRTEAELMTLLEVGSR